MKLRATGQRLIPVRPALRGRRGSTLLIVLALLSLLVLLTATLAYTTRLDVISSQNFASGIQRNLAAQSGIAKAASTLKDQLPDGPVGTISLYVDGIPVSTRREAGAGSPLPFPGVETPTMVFQVSDLSARININTADEETLTRFFGQVINESGAGGNPRAIARAIVAWRLGPDGAPGYLGIDDNQSVVLSLSASSSSDDKSNALLAALAARTSAPPTGADISVKNSCIAPVDGGTPVFKALIDGIDEQDEFVSDVRYPGFGDDRRFGSPVDLLQVDAVTPRLLAAALPHITVFSISQEVAPRRRFSEKPRSLVDVNRASAEEIYTLLADEFGTEKDDMLLRQFAVNLVDAADTDPVPSVLPDSTGAYHVIGIERTPVISEIYADSRSDDEDAGDDGQYIEIYNPWDQSVDLRGWKLKVGGTSHPLQGFLMSRGYLIVTDDYNGLGDEDTLEDLPGQGSFHEIFKIASNGGTKRILEIPILEVPHYQGRHAIQLLDPAGNLVDEFVYRVQGEVSTVSAFQRPNVLVREVRLATATPFALASGIADPDPETLDKLSRIPRDAPFLSTLELFEVFAGYATAEGAEGNRWGFPVLASAGSLTNARRKMADDPSVLDARLIDLFSVEMRERPRLGEENDVRKPLSELDLAGRSLGSGPVFSGDDRSTVGPRALDDQDVSEDVLELQAVTAAWYHLPPVGLRQGLVNVNTAPENVLISVGFSQVQAASIVQRRQELERRVLLGEAGDGILYRRLSDILVDDVLWSGEGGDSCSRIRAFAPIHARITTGSRAFLLEGIPREGTESSEPARSKARVKALVSMDREAPELVSWSFVY